MTLQPTMPFVAEDAPSPQKGGRIRRALVGGRLSDFGRLPRYLAFAILGGTLIWAPITGYLKTAPLSYKSTTSLILPGSGASASLNLNGIGQASSYANSAFANNAVSPTETYKRLLGADRILSEAADDLGVSRAEMGRPRVELVDQTSLIHIEMTGRSPEEAQQRGEAILAAFFAELDALRADEVSTREDSGLQAISDYRASVGGTRTEIANLQAQSGLISVEQYDVLMDRNLALEARILAKSAELSETSASVNALANQLELTPAMAAATLKLFADGAYLALLDEIADHEADLAQANSQYGARHPKVEEARKARDAAALAANQMAMAVTGLDDDSLAALDLAPQGARANLQAQLVQMEATRQGAARELATLKAQFEEGSADLARLAAAAAQLQDLERDFTVAEAVFASAIAKAQSSKSDVYASYPLVQVLENPSLAEKPSSPNRKLAIAAGGAATFMLLIGLMLGWVRLAVISRLMSKPRDE
ncbi:GumC family protein [Yoonia sp. R2331]|uniref:GumC family protein n=1 Tax=Yoonia sp. R2331 TaxID=3237238 RepID=UPI0034E5EB72